MTASGQPVTILMADDDEDDRELTRDALPDPRLAKQMKFVVDGQDLIDYLRRQGPYAERSDDAPRPGIILLDLNMPRKDGREVLREIKATAELRRIPVVVLTTSKAEEGHPAQLRPARQRVRDQAGRLRPLHRGRAADRRVLRDRRQAARPSRIKTTFVGKARRH
jgi:CheY-like chemotaxis protein